MILQSRVEPDPSFVMEQATARAIESLWNDPVMSQVMERSNEFYLMDSAP
jgi:guanine nucleotide-binding protein G(i) subunit alpha